MKRGTTASTVAALALIMAGVAGAISAPAQAAFPGHNGRIAFSSDRDGHPQIYTMNPDGACQARLTDSPRFDGFPAWSPDGTRIAFRSGRDGRGHEIYVMGANGRDPVRLTHNDTFDGGPSWSPDGRKIAFRSDRDGQAEIYVMNADGTNQTRLTHNEAVDAAPAWSPDGLEIAFVSLRDGHSQIYVMNSDGSKQTRLIRSRAWDAAPEWSPDGRKLAFDRSWVEREEPAGIFVANADGSSPIRLTGGPEVDGGPAWSPDGRRIAFRRADGQANEIYAMDADGSNQTLLTASASSDRRANWQARSTPLNRFCLGRQRLNTKRGFARQAVRAPGPGRIVVVRNQRVRRFVRTVEEPGPAGVRILPRGTARSRLERAGVAQRRVRVNARTRIRFIPDGGRPRARVVRLRLVRVGRR